MHLPSLWVRGRYLPFAIAELSTELATFHTCTSFLRYYADSKQPSYKITTMQMWVTYDKVKPTFRKCNKEADIVGVIADEGVSKSFRTGRLERELQMVQLSAIRYNCIAILWVSLLSLAAVTLCVASQRVFIVVVDFVITQSGNFWIHPRRFDRQGTIRFTKPELTISLV